jgi:hypothetical protein
MNIKIREISDKYVYVVVSVGNTDVYMGVYDKYELQDLIIDVQNALSNLEDASKRMKE